MRQALRACLRNKLKYDLPEIFDIKWLFEAAVRVASRSLMLVEIHERAPHQDNGDLAVLGIFFDVGANFVAIFLLQKDVGKDDIRLKTLGDFEYVDSGLNRLHFDGEVLQSQLHDLFDGGAFVSQQDA